MLMTNIEGSGYNAKVAECKRKIGVFVIKRRLKKYGIRVRNAGVVTPRGRRNLMEVEEIAKICHEVNRGLCEVLGDMSQTSWEDAPNWQRTSAINGVRNFQGGERAPASSHNSWMREKRATGWIYGETKNVEAKTHPCLVAFHLLSPEQRLKDELFVTVCRLLS